MVKKIYHEQKTIRRNIRQITILMLLWMLIACYNAKKDGDTSRILLCKIGLVMKGWMERENEMIACRLDGARPVILKIGRIDYED